ncbi:tRNA (guanine(46)-N(7))-methyltransferase TrmB [Candidatus Endolissoclinum faulkneri]|uniref:tRNA (guanine(46)-N(7))-methyltransferase TrmB n=1 Tax=Candidatus Endolissoclinum faulkneri TaxID=1263979 RepID=UPI001ED8C820|nr:tRNA (guanine(46)-N(7))-methyltransferase TrmB [Candidatus Endolissoclinum faulkneri]
MYKRRHQLFGRRKGRSLSANMKRLIDEELPCRLIPIFTSAISVTDPSIWFPKKPNAVWLEIGFGGGEHLAWQVQNNPSVALIGCEPFMNGVASLLRYLSKMEGDRVRIYPDDARNILDLLPNQCLERIFILHSDPWPKRRHHYRRIIQHKTINQLYDVLKPGGILRMSTDEPEYAIWILARITAHINFRWTGNSIADFIKTRKDWPETRYEAKGRKEERVPTYIEFCKPVEAN